MIRTSNTCALVRAGLIALGAIAGGDAVARQMYQSPQMMEEMRQEQLKLQAEAARVQRAVAAAQAALANENAGWPKTPLGKAVASLNIQRSPDAALDARAKLAELARNPDADIGDAMSSAQMGAGMMGFDVGMHDGGMDFEAIEAQMMAAMSAAQASVQPGAEAIGLPDFSTLMQGGQPGQPPPDPAAQKQAQKDAALLRLLVLAGDWPGVSAFLAEKGAEDARFIFNTALLALARGDQISLPDEALAVAEAAPGEITDGQVLALGALLQGATQRRSDPGPVVAAIGRGTKWFGGDDPAARARAARLLIAADLVFEASPYLSDLEEARAAGDAKALNLHALSLERLAQRTDTQDRLGAIRRAVGVCRDALACESATGADRRESIDRAVALAAILPEDEGAEWLREVFAGAPDAAWIAIAQTTGAARGLKQQMAQPEQRVDGLLACRRVVEAILSVYGDDLAGWRPALNMAALVVMEEARDTRSRRFNERMRYIPPSQFLPAAPTAVWMREIDRGLCFKATEALAAVAGAAGDTALALELLRPLPAWDADGAQRIAQGFLTAWAKAQRPGGRNDDEYWMYQQMYGGGYGYNPYAYRGRNYGGMERGLPLTRSRQQRNLETLGRVIVQLEEMGFRPLPPGVVAEAFASCHSEAEVFTEEDAERVFGPMRRMNGEAAAAVAESMRKMLTGAWRNQQVQQQARTKRTDKELAAEVIRGYDLALALAGIAADAAPADWERTALVADLRYDKAEFLYGRKADLETYAGLRDESFRGHQRAAEQYAAALLTGAAQPDARVYARWFSAALGASEAGALTRQDEPDATQIERLSAAIEALGKERAWAHRGLFAKSVHQQSQQLAPELKPRFIRNAMAIIGDHPLGKEPRELLALYDDLVREVRLILEVDGPTDVGHHSPFGARLMLRFTKAVSRESGAGFQRYLMNNTWSAFTNQQVSYKDDFEARIRTALGERFEVQACVFSEPQTQPMGSPEPGWLDLPMAYLVLSAKDASVDRIPALQLDMDFADSTGYVLLPVTSTPALIDARAARGAARPCKDLKIEATFDAREQAKGVWKLDVRASGVGTIPALADLLDLRSSVGLVQQKATDHGINVVALQTDADALEANAERSWTIEYAAASGAGVVSAPTSFTFPKLIAQGATLARKRIADADIVDAGETVALTPSTASRVLRPALFAGGFASIAAAGWFILARRRRNRDEQPQPRFVAPSPLTPLSAVAFLRRIETEAGGALRTPVRAELTASIAQIERAHFAPLRDQIPNGLPIDLASTVKNWSDRAQELCAPSRAG